MKRIGKVWMKRILSVLLVLALLSSPICTYASERRISDILGRLSFLSDTWQCVEFTSNTTSRDICLEEGDYAVVYPFHRVNTSYLSYNLQKVECSDPSVVSADFYKASSGMIGLRLHALLEGSADITAVYSTYTTRLGLNYIDERGNATFAQTIHVTVEPTGSVDVKLNISGGKYASTRGVTLSMVRMRDTLSAEQLQEVRNYINNAVNDYSWSGYNASQDQYGSGIMGSLMTSIGNAFGRIGNAVTRAVQNVGSVVGNVTSFIEGTLTAAERINHAYVYAKYESMRVPVFAPQNLTLSVTVTNNTNHTIGDISVLLEPDKYLSFTSITGPWETTKTLSGNISLEPGESQKVSTLIYPRFVYGTLSPESGAKVKAYTSSTEAKVTYTDLLTGKSGNVQKKIELNAYTTITQEKLTEYKQSLVQEYNAANVDAFTSGLLGGAFNGYERWYGYSCFSQVFIFACPVEAVIENQAGEELAVLSQDGDTYSGEGITGFVAGEAKYVVVEEDAIEDYRISARATDDGNMDVLTYEYDRETGVCVKAYDQLPLAKDEEFRLQSYPDMAADLGAVNTAGEVTLLEADYVIDQEMVIAGLMEAGLTEEEADAYADLLIRGVLPKKLSENFSGNVELEDFCSLLLNVAEDYFGIALTDPEDEDASAVQQAKAFGLLTQEQEDQIGTGNLTVEEALVLTDNLLKIMGFVDSETAIWDWGPLDAADVIAEEVADTGEPGEAEVSADTGEPGEAEVSADTGESGEAEASAEAGESGEAEASADAGESGEAEASADADKSADTGVLSGTGFSRNVGLDGGIRKGADLTTGEAFLLADRLLNYAEAAAERDSLIKRISDAYTNSLSWSREYSYLGLYASEPDEKSGLLFDNFIFWFPGLSPSYSLYGSFAGDIIPLLFEFSNYIMDNGDAVLAAEEQGYNAYCCWEMEGACTDENGTIYRWIPVCYMDDQMQIYEDAVYLVLAVMKEGAAEEYISANHAESEGASTMECFLITDQELVAGFLGASLPTGRFDALSDGYFEELGEGSSGDAVTELQEMLIQFGYLDGQADGTYGPGTAAAVSAYQEAKGLEVTGTADPDTQVMLYTEKSKIVKAWVQEHDSQEVYEAAMEELAQRETFPTYELPANATEDYQDF